MAKIGVRLKIDVSKIDKSLLFRGQKGTYLDATAFIDLDEQDQFGNSGMITQDLPKDRSQSGEKGSILGNSKVFWKGEGQQNPLSGYKPASQHASNQMNQNHQQQSFGGNGQGGFQQQPQQQSYNQERAPVNNDFDDSIPF